MDDQLLTGIRVLDLSQDIAGPYMTRLMAGMGAEVIKVEPPTGDPSRRVGPFPNHIPHREKSALYLYLNTSKRGVTLDLHTATGRDLLLRLVRKASTSWWRASAPAPSTMPASATTPCPRPTPASSSPQSLPSDRTAPTASFPPRNSPSTPSPASCTSPANPTRSP